MRKIFFIALMLLCGISLQAQYNTGIGDGYARGVTNNLQIEVSVIAPVLVSPDNIATNINTTTTFRWNFVQDVANYRLQIASDSLFTDIVINELLADTSALVSELSNNTNYYWRLKAIATTDSSAWSEVRGFKTLKEDLVGYSLWSWGRNDDGRVGDSTFINKIIPTKVSISSNWSKFSLGYSHSLAIKNNGTLWGWGNNQYGKIGDGTTTNKSYPIQIGTNSDWECVSAGGYHNLAIKKDGSMWGWGLNSNGQLAINGYSSLQVPTRIDTTNDWKIVSCGGFHTIAIKKNGSLWTWGNNNDGQLGDGANIQRTNPIQIGTDTNWTAVSAGYMHSVALKRDGSLWAWGNNWNGNLGDGTNVNRNYPVRCGSDTNWVKIESGTGQFYAIKSNGTLWESAVSSSYLISQKGTDTNWYDISKGYLHAVGVKRDGSLWAWGGNESGQLGNGTIVEQSQPIQIATTTIWSNALASDNHTMASERFSPNNFVGPILITPENNANNMAFTTQFAWNESIGANKFVFQLATNPTFNEIVSLNYPITETTTVNELQINTQYYWRIAAINGSDTSAWSEVRSFRTIECQTNIGNATNLGNYTPLDRYYNYSSAEILNLASEVGPARSLTTLAFNKISGADSNSIQNVRIYLKHTQDTIFTNGAYSLDGYTLVYSGDFPNSAANGLKTVNLTTPFNYNGIDNLSVLVLKGFQAYILSNMPKWEYTIASNTKQRFASIDANQPTYLSTTVNRTNVQFNCTNAVIMNPPYLNLPSDKVVLMPGQNNLSWYGVYSASAYVVQVATDSNFTNIYYSDTVSTNFANIVTSIFPDNFWRVSAINGTEISSWSEVRKFYNSYPRIPILTSPADLSTNISNSPAFEWSTAMNAVNYRVQVSLNDTFTNLVLDEVSSGINTSLFDLQNNTEYFWRVRSKSATDSSDWSSVFSFTTELVTPQGYRLYTWGTNNTGQLGTGDTINRSIPVRIGGNWLKVAGAWDNSFAIKSNGTLWAWGKGRYLGLGTTADKWKPTQIGSDTNWRIISSHNEHSMAIKTDGSLWAWGDPSFGKLGADNYAESPNYNGSWVIAPIQVGTETNWSYVCCGGDHTTAIKTDGTLWAWGYNAYGQIGDGTYTHKYIPTQIGSLNNWKELSSGRTSTLAIKTDGTLWSWGSNIYGQLGDGTTINKLVPTQIGTDTNWKVIAAGNYRSYAIKTDGTFWKWGLEGSGYNGEISTAPVQIGSDTVWKTISGIYDKVFTTKSDGTLWKWEYDSSGQFVATQVEDFNRCNGVTCGHFHSLALQSPNIDLAAPILLSPADSSVDQILSPNLTWGIVANAVTYRLEVSTTQDFATTLITQIGIADTIFQLENLTYNTQYYWRVKAYSNSDSSTWSNTRQYRTKQQLMPPNLIAPMDNATDLDYHLVLLQYQTVNAYQPYLYELRWAKDSNIVFLDGNVVTGGVIINTPNFVFSYDLFNLTPNSTYYWKARTFFGTDTSAWSEARIFTTRDIVATPELLIPSNLSNYVSINPEFTWTPINNATEYRLQLASDSLFENIIATQYGTNANSVVNDLLFNTNYYWRVKGFSSTDSSQWSQIYRFTTKSNILNRHTYLPISIPQGISWQDAQNAALQMGGHLVTLTSQEENNFVYDLIANNDKYWDGGLGPWIGGFQQDSSTEPSGNWKWVTGEEFVYSNWAQYEPNNNGNEDKLHYYSYSNNWNDKSGVHLVKGYIVEFSPILPPALLSPAKNLTNVSTTINLTWSNIDNATSYKLLLASDSLFTNILNNQEYSNTNATINNLSNLENYYWKVRALNSTDTSVWSEVSRFTTVAGIPVIPELVSPANSAFNTSLNPVLVWNTALNGSNYRLQVSQSTSFENLLVNSDQVNTSKQLNGLTNSTTYYWRVQASNNWFTSEWSEVRSFTTAALNATTTNLNITALLTGLWSSNSHKAAAVTIELRTGGASVTSSVLYKRVPGLISSDGTISVNVNNSQLVTNDYWLVVRSVGYLPVSSAQKVHIEVGQAFSYDFSRTISSVSSASMLKLIGDRYFLKVGDLNSDRNIQGGDMSLVKANSGNTNTVPILNNLDATNGTGANNATLNLTTLLTGNWNGTVHKENSIMIELRTGTTLANSVVYKRIPALISATGEVSVSMTNFAGGDYWIIVRASGYVPISSAQKVTIPADATASYDFSRSSSSVSSSSMLKASNGRYLMKVGDLNADRSVSGADMSAIKANSGGGSTIPGL